MVNNNTEYPIQMWLAEMDFKAPICILDSIKNIADYGMFGYPNISNHYFETVSNWFALNHNYIIDENNIIPVNGTLSAIRAILEEFSEAGDNILIQSPVYHVFYEIIETANRYVLINNLTIKNKTYEIDFDNFEFLLLTKRPKIFILCSPHNPIGKVWNANDLQKLLELCNRYQVLLISDEIHCDLVFNNNFISIFKLDKALLNNAIVLTAPTKTFNIAGIRGGNVFVFNVDIKNRLSKRFTRHGVNKINTLFVEVIKAGYNNGTDWLNKTKDLILKNYNYVNDFCKEYIPQLNAFNLDATYLLWIDYRQLQIVENDFFNSLDSKLILARGSKFGNNGTGLFRISIACHQIKIEKALNIIKEHIYLIKS